MSYPDTHWQLTQKMADIMESAKKNDAITKVEVLEQLEEVIAIMMKKIVAHPTMTSYCIFRGT